MFSSSVQLAALMEFLHVSRSHWCKTCLILAVLRWHSRCPIGHMHITIDRLYDFVMGALNLTDDEQSHLIRCPHCVEWLDICVEERVSLLTDRIRSGEAVSPRREAS